MDSLERAFDAFPTLEGVAQDASKEACAPLEERIPTGGPPSTSNVMGETPSIETTVAPFLFARKFNLVIGGPRRPRGPNRLVLNSPVKPMKWDHPPADTFVPGPDSAQSIINLGNPINQRDASSPICENSTPTNLQILVVALSKEYSIPFLGYLDKKIYQRVSRPCTRPGPKAEPDPGTRTNFTIYTFSNTVEINVL